MDLDNELNPTFGLLLAGLSYGNFLFSEGLGSKVGQHAAYLLKIGFATFLDDNQGVETPPVDPYASYYGFEMKSALGEPTCSFTDPEQYSSTNSNVGLYVAAGITAAYGLSLLVDELRNNSESKRSKETVEINPPAIESAQKREDNKELNNNEKSTRALRREELVEKRRRKNGRK